VQHSFSNFLQSGDRNGTPSRRSKSEGPPLANGRCVNVSDNDGKHIMEKVFQKKIKIKKTSLMYKYFHAKKKKVMHMECLMFTVNFDFE
jgi:hypothetical protein